MTKIDKYRIVNYFALWLTENDLVSKEVTFVFEKYKVFTLYFLFDTIIIGFLIDKKVIMWRIIC